MPSRRWSSGRARTRGERGKKETWASKAQKSNGKSTKELLFCTGAVRTTRPATATAATAATAAAATATKNVDLFGCATRYICEIFIFRSDVF